MRYGCPNSECKYHGKKNYLSKDGIYHRKNDSRIIQRYRCAHCGKRFSNATFSLAFGQKKRRVNHTLFENLASGMSMRRCARNLKIHRTTVKRKLIYLAKKARLSQEALLKKLRDKPILKMQFDDLVTIEHTKLKPLSVSTAVDSENRTILGAVVSQIPAFGLLAEPSRKKYGKRKSFHRKGLTKLFEDIKEIIDPAALIESDEHKLYPQFVEEYFPNSEYKRYKGSRSSVAGQGEMKKIKFDPLFMINQTLAMLRANINRLIRKTWCTTKDPQMLQNHIDIYIQYHNLNL